MKCKNIRIIGIPEGEEEQGIENLFEKVMTESFPNLMREEVTQTQEAQRVPIKRDTNRSTPRHIIIEMAKFQGKERILKAARERKQEVTYKGTLIRPAAAFSVETLQARREWQVIYQGMKNKGLQPTPLYPLKPSIKMESQIKSFTDKRSLKEYSSSKPSLQEWLKGPL